LSVSPDGFPIDPDLPVDLSLADSFFQ